MPPGGKQGSLQEGGGSLPYLGLRLGRSGWGGRGVMATPAMSGQGRTSQNDIPRKTAGRKPYSEGKECRGKLWQPSGTPRPEDREMAFATRLQLQGSVCGNTVAEKAEGREKEKRGMRPVEEASEVKPFRGTGRPPHPHPHPACRGPVCGGETHPSFTRARTPGKSQAPARRADPLSEFAVEVGTLTRAALEQGNCQRRR